MWNTLYFMSIYATIIWMLLIFHFFLASHLRIIRPSYLENLCCNLKRYYVDFLHWYLCSALIFTIFHLIMHINSEMHCPHPHIPSKPSKFSNNQISHLFDNNEFLSLSKYTSLNKFWNIPFITYKSKGIFWLMFFGNLQFIRSFQVFMFLL